MSSLFEMIQHYVDKQGGELAWTLINNSQL
jgi:hypothetical protein